MRRVRFAKACRECGAEGSTPYRTVVGVRAALCQACAQDYQQAECRCEVRAVERERAMEAAAAARAGVAHDKLPRLTAQQTKVLQFLGTDPRGEWSVGTMNLPDDECRQLAKLGLASVFSYRGGRRVKLTDAGRAALKAHS